MSDILSSRKNLVVLDWSNLLFRSLFVTSLFNKNASYDDYEDVKTFIGKFATDVLFLLKIFKPTNVIIATDSRNIWRKDYLFGSNGYKSNRSRDDIHNWDNIFKGADALKDLFEKHGLNVANVDRCEADDITALCKEVVFEKFPDYNIVIISADADIRQIIDFNNVTHQYCAVYNTIGKGKGGKRNLYVTKDFIDWINEPDQSDIFFSNLDSNKQNIKMLLRKNQNIQLVEEDPNAVVLHKIFCGDDGDCVPSIYEWYKNGKKVRVTMSKFLKIQEMIGFKTVGELIEKQSKLQEVMSKVLKKDLDDLNCIMRLNFQRKLVELNSELFPDNIRDYKKDIEKMISKTPRFNFWNIKTDELFEGTEFETILNVKKAKDAEVFKNLNKYLDSSMTKLW